MFYFGSKPSFCYMVQNIYFLKPYHPICVHQSGELLEQVSSWDLFILSNEQCPALACFGHPWCHLLIRMCMTFQPVQLCVHVILLTCQFRRNKKKGTSFINMREKFNKIKTKGMKWVLDCTQSKSCNASATARSEIHCNFMMTVQTLIKANQNNITWA